MRVTAQVQAATRQRILEVAQELLASQGFDATTTRDIAKAAGIATGTMFNYFSSRKQWSESGG
jgi:AcrR family transcriptional regulator